MSKSLFQSLSVVFSVMLLAACNNGAHSENMQVGSVPNADFGKYSYNIALYEAGNDTRWDRRVSHKSFYEALKSSLYSNYLLNEQNPKYELSANIITLTPPTKDFSMHVTADVHYLIRDVRTGEIVVDKTLSNEGVATRTDEQLLVARQRLADERAVNGNIEQFVNYLRR